MFAAPDYKALYFELFRASEQAARLLWEAQQKAEQEALRADPPPLELEPLRHRSRDATSPKVGGLGNICKLHLYAKGSPFGRAGERSETERVSQLSYFLSCTG